jgi:hypothetical protein
MSQREILDFKAYYLHHTFMPLIETTDGEDNLETILERQQYECHM